MNPLNHIQVEGNLTKDPAMNQTRKGRAVCKFSIATDHFFRMGDQTEKDTSFFDIEAWDNLAEICGRIGRKGRGCRVTGRLKQEKWNAPDGSLRSRVVIVAENIEYKSDRKESDERGGKA
jgi:single-strand DNA-binding protein